MSAAYHEHRCSSCGAVVGGTTRVRPTIGSPFTECTSCGGFAPRPPYDEWAGMSPSVKLGFIGRALTRSLVVGLAPALLYGLFAIVTARGSDRLWLLALAAGGVLIAATVWASLLAQEIRRSSKRLADPMYSAKLVEYGIQTHVPNGTDAPHS
jgi:hypothetical protein